MLIRQGIHHRDANYQKQVGHLFDGDRIGAVADDAKKGKQPQGETQLQINILQQVRQKEDRNADKDVGEKIVLAAIVAVINVPDDDQGKYQVDQKTKSHHKEIALVEEVDAK
jgi:hypothetical protein